MTRSVPALVHHDGGWADSLDLDERLTGPHVRIRDVLIDRPSKPAASTHSPLCIHTIMLGPPMRSIAHRVAVHARDLRPRQVRLPLATTGSAVLPSACEERV